jgi:hypothetical protein
MAHLKLAEKNDDLIERIRLLLLEAKPAGYASGTENWENLPDGGIRFFYPPKDGLQYSDQYWGYNPFWGYEKIIDQKSGTPVWFMSYHGRVFRDILGKQIFIANVARVKGIYAFLKTVLFNPDSFLPLRGRSGKNSGALVYHNHTQQGSNLMSFSGKEMITHGGEARYDLYYNGGIVMKRK